MRRLLMIALAVAALASPGQAAADNPSPREFTTGLWHRVAPEYGTNLPSFVFGKIPAPGQAWAITSTPVDGSASTIYFGRAVTLEMKSRDYKLRLDARRVALWEFGRTIEGDRGEGWLAHKTNKTIRELNRR